MKENLLLLRDLLEHWKTRFLNTWQLFQKKFNSDKFLKDKAFKIASDPKYDGYQRGLASMVYKFFDKKSSGSGFDTEPNYQLSNELHRQIIKKIKMSLFLYVSLLISTILYIRTKNFFWWHKILNNKLFT